MTRRFVIIGQKATASPEFSLIDIAGTSGRLDILLRCLRSALLVSHGLRRDTIVYLVLLGGPLAPRVLRVDGRHVRFIRPDERMLAILVQKALARSAPDAEPGVFVEIRPGLAVARGGVDAVLADLGSGDGKPGAAYVLEEDARDLRDGPLASDDVVVFVGDNHGFDEPTRARLAAAGAVPIGVGPISVHADDAITIVCNEMDRRHAASSGAASSRNAGSAGSPPS
jgi:tRNA (pseudouridine54-N1)-methyltransferase